MWANWQSIAMFRQRFDVKLKALDQIPCCFISGIPVNVKPFESGRKSVKCAPILLNNVRHLKGEGRLFTK
jgi:hypothetical protein